MGNYHALLSKSPAFFAEQARLNSGSNPPPQWVLDRLADEKFTGKFDVSRSNMCQTCFCAKSVNGTCFCD